MIIATIITLIFGYIAWYVTLVPINPQSESFWIFVAALILIHQTIYVIYREIKKHKIIVEEINKDETVKSKFSSYFEERKKMRSGKKKILKYLIPIAILLIVVAVASSSKILNAKKYSKMLTVVNGDFEEDISEISIDQIPVVDRTTAIKLGDRKMGEMVDLASQFNVSDAYTQIDFKDKPVRVTPLEYNGLLKWFNNKKNGIPGYITVDMANGKTILNKLDKNIKYSKSDKFGRDISRHLTKNYPTRIFYNTSFEIDEDGNPYWIASTYKKTIGFFGGEDVNTVLVADAVTGAIKEYKVEDTPTWIDRAYDSDRIIEQIDNWGSLKSGYINSLFSQKGVLLSTKGYNYLAIDDDVYLYTGITSASRDNSNVGFMLTNLRTKETKFYEISSADEYSAMASAEGEVQEKEYTSTFPILLNINSKPTYMMALKDHGQLIKGYALVDAQDYQEVSFGATVEETLKKHGVEIEDTGSEDTEKTIITIEEIENVTIDGNTYYYIKSNNEVYVVKININENLPFMKSGTAVEIEYYLDKKGIKRIDKLGLPTAEE